MMTRRELFARLAVAPFAAPLALAALPHMQVTVKNGLSAFPRLPENMAQAIVKLIAADALPMLMDNLVMGNLVSRSYEPEVSIAGDTVNVPLPPFLKSPDPDRKSITFTSLGNARIVLNKHMEATFSLPDVARALADPEYLSMFMTPATIALAESIERDLLALRFGSSCSLSGCSNNSFQWPAVSPYHAAPRSGMTEQLVDMAETSLFYGRVPESVSKYLVVSGQAYSELRKIPRFSEYTSKDGLARGPAQYRGTVGRIKNFYVFRSQLVRPLAIFGQFRKMDGSMSDRYEGPTPNLAFAQAALGLITRRPPVAGWEAGAISEFAELSDFGLCVTLGYNPSSLAQMITIHMLYGAGVLRDNHGVQVYS
jgi:P22 coat protein - gene protein 5